MSNVYDFLCERNFIDQSTSEDLRDVLQQPRNFYFGIDPTASHLHLGHLVGIVFCMHMQRFGHRPVLLIGGATGLIGDPSFKDQERPLLTQEQVQQNVKGLVKSLKKFLDFDHPIAKPIVLNNYDWFSKMSVVEFLRDVGKQFRIGAMMGKESVRSRFNSEEGMSFTEFSYQLLQGYDFAYLYKRENVILQIGGSDQYGNITAGIEYTRRVYSDVVYGMTFPLLTRSDGKKFGKSEKGAIWLSEELCSPFELYQYLYRVPDQDVIRMFCMLTLLDIQEIRSIQLSMKKDDYQVNSAQKRLAEEVTRLIHGETGLQRAMRTTEAIAPGKMNFDEEHLREVAKNMPNVSLAKKDVVGASFVDVIVYAKLVSSKSEARRLIQNGGAYLNGEKVLEGSYVVEEKDVLKGNVLVVSSGKKNPLLIQLM